MARTVEFVVVKVTRGYINVSGEGRKTAGLHVSPKPFVKSFIFFNKLFIKIILNIQKNKSHGYRANKLRVLLIL